MLLSSYNKHNTNAHAPGGLGAHKPSKRTTADPRLRLRSHWDRHTGNAVRASDDFYKLKYKNNMDDINKYVGLYDISILHENTLCQFC
jgi:hypothetical protein